MAAENLVAARDNLELLVEQQTALWVAAGCPPTMSVDGESYDWNGWLADKTAAIEKLTDLIRVRGGPAFIVRSRGRA